ncbi:TolB family protein [Parafrankia discariae]|uniref:TolB family protein n=1 Tax=Parafrankia discariae TaxID=365528 RepID=UPI00037DB9A2|nr:hypothetical protein [Parafrankia discariae]
MFLINADGSGRRRISTARDAYELSWSPDGAQIVFRGGGDQSLHVLSLDGTGERALGGRTAAVWSEGRLPLATDLSRPHTTDAEPTSAAPTA